MAAREFEDWLGDLIELVRDEMDVELEELEDYEELDAKSYWADGYSPRIYMEEVLSNDDDDTSFSEDDEYLN